MGRLTLSLIFVLFSATTLAGQSGGKGSGHGNGIGVRSAPTSTAPDAGRQPTAARSYRYAGR